MRLFLLKMHSEYVRKEETVLRLSAFPRLMDTQAHTRVVTQHKSERLILYYLYLLFFFIYGWLKKRWTLTVDAKTHWTSHFIIFSDLVRRRMPVSQDLSNEFNRKGVCWKACIRIILLKCCRKYNLILRFWEIRAHVNLAPVHSEKPSVKLRDISSIFLYGQEGT